MSTAYEMTQEFRALVESCAQGAGQMLPQLRFTTFADPSVQRESFIVGVTNVAPWVDQTGRLGLERCAPPQTATIKAIIARDYVCQNQDGTDDPDAIMRASLVMQKDADVLWEAVYLVEPYLGPQGVSVDAEIAGGLVAVSASFSIGIH